MRTATARTPELFLSLIAWTGAACVVAVLGWILVDIARRGLGSLTPTFFLGSTDALVSSDGILPVLVSTFAVIGTCLMVVTPVSLGAALALSDLSLRDSRAGRWIRASLDALAAVPSIVFGLFGSAFFCVLLGMGTSILAGGLTLACMVLPTMIRTAEEAFRSVPASSRRGAAALGLSRWATMRRVLIPAAAPGLGAGFLLGVGRALAETAAVVFTAGYVVRMPTSLWDEGRTLSVHIYELALKVPGGDGEACATALLLVALLLLTHSATLMFHRGEPGTG